MTYEQLSIMSAEDLQRQIEQLRGKVAELERECDRLERECNAIQDELREFEDRYNTLIKPLTDQIEAVKSAIESLKEAQFKKELGEKIRMEELWKRARASMDDDASPPEDDDAFGTARKPKNPAKRLKQLYRQLARRFHPDLARDDNDRQRRTRLMAMINSAYQDEDLDTLETLREAAPVDIRQPSIVLDTSTPLSVLVLRRLQRQYEDLAIKLRDLRDRHSDLRYGTMMSLKLEASLASARGEDLLQELAEEMQAEYWEYMQELDALRTELE